MPEETEILRIDKPHFTVRVYENMLKIDLKGSLKNDIEEAFENTPILEQTIGSILEMFVPLHVHLSEVDSVSMDEKGKVLITLPRHRDVVIPLEPGDAKGLVDKLNELIPEAKEKELTRIMKEQKLQRYENAERDRARGDMLLPPGGTQFPSPEPPGFRQKEKEAAEEQEK